MAGSSPEADWQPYVEVFVTLGYDPRGPRGVPDRELLVLDQEELRTHHLSLVRVGEVFWRDHLAFRDRLRSKPALAEAYAALKRGLARRYPTDREAYTAGKAAFVNEVVRGSIRPRDADRSDEGAAGGVSGARACRRMEVSGSTTTGGPAIGPFQTSRVISGSRGCSSLR
jgi:hypothetical protein